MLSPSILILDHMLIPPWKPPRECCPRLPRRQTRLSRSPNPPRISPSRMASAMSPTFHGLENWQPADSHRYDLI